MLAEQVLRKGRFKNALKFGACMRFMQVVAPFFVPFAGLSGRGLFQPREAHKSCLRRDFVLQSFAVRGHCGWKEELWFAVCLLEHERYYGLGMDALVIALMEMNGIMVLGRHALVIALMEMNGIMVWA